MSPVHGTYPNSLVMTGVRNKKHAENDETVGSGINLSSPLSHISDVGFS